MAIRAGQILHLGGNDTLIDRLQSAGLGDINIGTDTIRETGNYENVEKVLQDPDLSFSMESFDVSTEIEALLCGDPTGGASAAANQKYLFSDMKAVHIKSPWKNESAGSAGTIDGGLVVPNYFVTRASYRFGVDDNAGETFELAGSEAYYARKIPEIEQFTASGGASAFTLSASAARHSVGGYNSTVTKYVLGVIKTPSGLTGGQVMVEGTDYTVDTSAADAFKPTITFTTAPASASIVSVAYFDAQNTDAFAQTVHPVATVKPGAVRGRDIEVYMHLPASGAEASGVIKLGGVQSVTVDASKQTTLEREMGTSTPIARTLESTDVTGDMGMHPTDQAAFFTMMRRITGVASAQVIGVLNNFPVGLEVRILNPSNRGSILKTLFVKDAKFQIPATPARAGAVVDFTLRWESNGGELEIYNGIRP